MNILNKILNFGRKEVTPIDELKKIPQYKWAKISCTFNKWEYPEELAHIKPKWWDEVEGKNGSDMKFAYCIPIMKFIENAIGKKSVNRYWNKDRMTDYEHEIFWEKNFRNIS